METKEKQRLMVGANYKSSTQVLGTATRGLLDVSPEEPLGSQTE